MATTGASSKPGGSLVSSAERTGFVEAVLAGKLVPDLSAVAYHFEGWLDKDVVDAVFEVSSGPTEAVSALAGMFPSEPAPADSRSSNSTSDEEGADQTSATTTQAAPAPAPAATAATDAVLLTNKKHARTLQDIQVQRGPPPSPTAAVAPASPAAGEDEAGSPEAEAGAEAESPDADARDEAESPDADEGPETKSPDADAGDEAESPAADAGPETESPDADAGDGAEYPEADAGAEAESPDAGAEPEAASPEADAGAEAESPDAEAGPEAASPEADAGAEAESPDAEAGPEAASPEADARAEAESPDAAAGPEVEVGPAIGGVDESSSSSSSSNAELEKVAAFIASYAGEQEPAAAVAPRTPAKPLEPPFLVPRGISVPSTRKVQLAIAKTAEKAVELPGFEAFMKMQHGKDSLYRFLAVEHALHSYYLVAKKHVQEAVMKGGKAKGACAAAEPRQDPPAANEKTEDPDVAEIMRMLGGVGP